MAPPQLLTSQRIQHVGVRLMRMSLGKRSAQACGMDARALGAPHPTLDRVFNRMQYELSRSIEIVENPAT